MRILVLTSIYPSKEATKGTTPVVHYFCEEWVKQGHEVIVIHNDNKYLFIFYLLPPCIKSILASTFGVILPNITMRKRKCYELDNVKVFRIPILKIIPFGKFYPFQIKNQLKKILCFLELENFVPDLITGHWENPQIELIYNLKKRFQNVRTSVVIHVLKYLEDMTTRRMLFSFDSIGFRNKTLMDNFKTNYHSDFSNYYICYSGLQDSFTANIDAMGIPLKFENNVLSIVFVGLFLKRKNAGSIIEAVYMLNDKLNVRIDLVGEGNEKKNVNKLVDKYQLQEKVKFYDRIPRVEVQNILKVSQVFIMISKDEAFGLVYLEAMACGCIVVASINEGFDGIIIDGFNGFLCRAGDKFELSKILLKIKNLTRDEKYLMSRNAMKTALLFTNAHVSQKYLDSMLMDVV